VYEEYLQWRWRQLGDEFSQVPTGAGSVALMRIMVMAQSQHEFLDAYQELPENDREMLDAELSKTGCIGQAYLCEGHSMEYGDGPAFLVYYGPALLQKNGAEAMRALQVLAEVLRQARSLWQASAANSDKSVTVRIDALKELAVSAMQENKPGELWALQRSSGVDGQVVRLSVIDANGAPKHVDWSTHRLLNLGGVRRGESDHKRGGTIDLATFVAPKIAYLETGSLQEEPPTRGWWPKFLCCSSTASDRAEVEL
jgi:hypothetical protein